MQQQYGLGGNYNPYGMATGALGSIAGGVGSLFAQNPANASSPYLNQLTNSLQGIYSPWMGQQAQQSLNPYLQGGQWAQGGLQNATSNMINNPTGLFNQWGSTYQSSPGYNWQVGQAGEAANNAAAAGGMAGSQAEQQNIAGTVNQLANQDYWQYINNAQNLYGQGYQGLQNQYGIGAQAANNMYGAGAQAAN
ncbi:MAG TPA: hypothetical protein VHZ76_00980, partial [Gammaproteobacteria bacterium]|nr:hypothetical protein [Gammaproteobacteria bacterium]